MRETALTTMARGALTPNELARLYHIGIHKVLGWIGDGSLRAINVASDVAGRPQWKILAADLAAFEAQRAARPAPVVPQRKRKAIGADVEEFF